MALTQIGRNSVGDIKFGVPGAAAGSEVSYRTIFQFFSIRSIVPQVDASTFASEPNTEYEPGESVMIATMNGLAKRNTGALPIATAWLPAPQKVSSIFQYDTSCTVAGIFNFEDTLVTRGVNTNSVIAGTARSTGATVVSWVTSG